MTIVALLRRSVLARLGFSAALTLLCLGLVEAALWTSRGAPSGANLGVTAGDLERYNRGCATVEVEGGQEWIVVHGNGGPNHHRRILREKPDGIRRIVLVGESTGQRLGGHIEQLVDALGPEAHVEFLNCGSGGITLRFLEPWISEALSYGPDDLLVVFGHNTGFEVPEEATSAAWVAFWRTATYSHALSAIANLEVFPAPEPVRYEAQVNQLEQQLRQLASTAERRDIRLHVATLDANLRFAPSPPASALATARHWRLVFAADSAALAEEADEWRPGGPAGGGLWPYLQGMIALRRGQVAEAQEALDAALEHDPRASRAHRAVRTLLASGHGWQVFDLAGAIEKQSPEPVAGWATFEDDCHPRHRWLHGAAREFLSEVGLPSARGESDPHGSPSLAEWFRFHRRLRSGTGSHAQRTSFVDRIADTVTRGESSVGEVHTLAVQAFETKSTAGEAILEDVAIGLARGGHPKEALELLAPGERGTGADAWFAAARIHVMAGAGDLAKAALGEALHLDPEHLAAKAYTKALASETR